MALAAVENLIQQARSMPQDEVDKLAALALETFQQSEKSGDSLFALRQLVFIMQVSTTEPTLPKKLISLMMQSIGGMSRSSIHKKRQCMLCSDIIREMLPSQDVILQEGQAPLTPNKTMHYLPLYTLQENITGCVDKMLPLALRWLSEQKLEFEVQRKIFIFLVAVETLHKSKLSKDEILMVNHKVSDWLMTTSLSQAPNPYTYNPFKKDQNVPVQEIDGTPTRNFYSVLNVGQYSTEDQLLNIFTFSLLFKWLKSSSLSQEFQTGDCTPSSNQGETIKHTESPTPQYQQSINPSLSTTYSSLLSKIVDYCFRIMDQCERKPKVPQDCDLQNASLQEVVKIMDLACSIDPGQLAKVFQEVKRLFSRLSQDDSQPRILLQIIQFFLNHCKAVVYDPQPAYDLFFGNLISSHYGNVALAYETLQFIRDNLETLCYSTNVLSKFFPNIFKILAWNPRSFVADLVDIIPAIMSPSSTIEVLHTVLDLPCICAAMEVSQRAQKGEIIQGQQEMTSIQSFRDPIYNLMFKFMLRAEGGCGDTISRLKDLHDILKDHCNNPRVIVCGQVVPVLLKEFFSVIEEEGDIKLANQLFPVILERAGLLYEIQEYQTDVRRVLAESLYQLLKSYPSLVVDQFTEIMEYIMSTRNITDKELLFSNLVWGVGEYSSNSHDKRCTPEMISKYYEALEALAYESSGTLQSASEEESPFSPRLLAILISALSKLATRCQDLIPRVLLCLTKISQQQRNSNLEPETRDILVERAQELINLLKLPNFASVILNPPKEIETGSWHSNPVSEAVILRTTHRILRPDL